MTNQLTLRSLDIPSIHKFSVGFDRMFDELTRNQTQQSNYPPYNIVKVDENNYVIELAVAGFGKQNIDIEIANNTLVIKGGLTLDQLDPGTNLTYLYKGIADRAFTRKFTLADTVEVKNAELINGMLKLWLENIIPEEKKPKKIDIVDKGELTSKEK